MASPPTNATDARNTLIMDCPPGYEANGRRRFGLGYLLCLKKGPWSPPAPGLDAVYSPAVITDIVTRFGPVKRGFRAINCPKGAREGGAGLEGACGAARIPISLPHAC